jgi:AcrR family transcriptional regulator
MSTRDNIIDAAMAIVRDSGVARLTLDEAAKVAGVSKGGVLYHFKSKDDLIRGMVARLIEQCETLHRGYYEDEPEGPYRWARTVVRTAFDPNGPANDPAGGALLAAMAVNRGLVAPLQAKYEEWLERLKSDSPDPVRAGLICTAMDGLLLQRVMGLRLRDEDGEASLQRTALDLLT